MKKLLILFDCDGVLWTPEKKGDYVSSVVSKFRRVSNKKLIREADNSIFKLSDGVKQCFQHLIRLNEKVVVGIVSDNKFDTAKEVMMLFDLYKFVHKDAFNVKLWKGYCPKDRMVLEILEKPVFKNMPYENVYLLDDKDYGKECRSIGVNFIQVCPDANLYKLVKDLVKDVE